MAEKRPRRAGADLAPAPGDVSRASSARRFTQAWRTRFLEATIRDRQAQHARTIIEIAQRKSPASTGSAKGHAPERSREQLTRHGLLALQGRRGGKKWVA
jgi:hypothetical protein